MFNDFIVHINNALGASNSKVIVIALVIFLYVSIGWFINSYGERHYQYPVVSENWNYILFLAACIGVAIFLGILISSGTGLLSGEEVMKLIVFGILVGFIALYVRIYRNTSLLFATFSYIYMVTFSIILITIAFILAMASSRRDDQN
ncbi:hypothetical protein FA592_03075 [Sulfurospirillum diekertiae]|uniref:Uncharacterized protein n=1 Tax=Sulfurospirillum diekertiae TaxID=1854492 RepID=A0A6G9VP20_9BACT|nr:hypothetical protein [Sulfurospirillum diekertiae]QIR75263.1 hypothetical protein FA584_03175 [Sulfurospirillum diekertiae]QIR77915.1 hypothetical protein FA592_03075 [Sulfurospirillum diekertiae]